MPSVRNLAKTFFLGELLALVDLSTTVKTGVQYSLWGGSVLSLGTAKHRDLYYEDINAFRLPGCFAMTELGHGSNVAGLQTEAVLDVERDEWVITTPVRVLTFVFVVSASVLDHFPRFLTLYILLFVF